MIWFYNLINCFVSKFKIKISYQTVSLARFRQLEVSVLDLDHRSQKIFLERIGCWKDNGKRKHFYNLNNSFNQAGNTMKWIPHIGILHSTRFHRCVYNLPYRSNNFSYLISNKKHQQITKCLHTGLRTATSAWYEDYWRSRTLHFSVISNFY